MIDIENEVFTKVLDFVHEQEGFEQVEGDTVYTPTPPSLPFIELSEVSNSVNYETIDSGSLENSVIVSYEVNIYSNKTSGKKAEAKKLVGYVDEEMRRLGFVRQSKLPIPNLADATIYRVLLRYTAEVDKNKVIYTRR